MRLVNVTPLDGFKLRVGLQDGTSRDVDVSRYISRGDIFAPVRTDRSYFESVTIDAVDRTVTWPNGANIDTLVLLGERQPATEALTKA